MKKYIIGGAVGAVLGFAACWGLGILFCKKMEQLDVEEVNAATSDDYADEGAESIC